ncbi:potassium voltage-gated channel subfamily KQT member 1-like [Oncorhynchus kisutch]|uniref:potassium voltage-gated channel subfamily KQT member 1-like n=1 Tax=Oncorhynchus kisutch TaxID=8019 RepID=UPI00099F869F|nr:potassium voltage-gated channel subfamily KQT member 1-like [Oncorhynchus kisutch]
MEETGGRRAGWSPGQLNRLSHAHKAAVKVLRRMKYFVARQKFQQARKPYDVRDVMEQYNQGHLTMMVRIKELQRRLDHTLGKPGMFLPEKGVDKEYHTVGARLIRLEDKIYQMDHKMEAVLKILVDQYKPKAELLLRAPAPPPQAPYSSRISIVRRQSIGVSLDEGR